MKRILELGCLSALLGLAAHAVCAAPVKGLIVDVAGKPIPFVRIRIAGEDATRFSTTVFSGSDGKFEALNVNVASKTPDIDVFRIGYKEVKRQVAGAANGEGLALSVTMQKQSNVADQVPASAWLGGDSESTPYQMTMVQCSNCHQLGADRMRRLAEKLKGKPMSERTEAWLH
ncbi:MAG: hypothetical protein M3O06_11155, partial [Pseudomonadota bacterium]|nr:hypothetical protein [Pseudomonadota bacterium]